MKTKILLFCALACSALTAFAASTANNNSQSTATNNRTHATSQAEANNSQKQHNEQGAPLKSWHW